ncbi:hypothetical protein HELRODRAFT_177655 [Helobdella robusta]|uniref:Mitochondria-eating protein n=1 Tax=Helobdella robusta TaxID=6412 RepID=T1FC09_HELRO|nr:hypothetical protein HELRODRAFT_177655 [Helobdella robusta]ESN97983.1 hypothetical protein HELRODRAFT_177655 [Helobdella robusta]
MNLICCRDHSGFRGLTPILISPVLNNEIFLLLVKLSEQARRQLAKGSSKFEDLSLGANRPTQLIKRYGNLYSEARVDALDALENLPELSECDDLKTKLLLSIIVLSFRSTQKTLLDLKTRVREMLHIPRVLQSGLPHLCHAANDLEDDIGVYLRKTLDKHDLRRNYNEVSERVWITLFDYPSLRNCNGLTRYIEECVSVAWSLTVQNPPMLIDYEMGPFDQTKHSRFHTSDPNSKAIKVYLWPALTEGEKGACVSKGIVIT